MFTRGESCLGLPHFSGRPEKISAAGGSNGTENGTCILTDLPFDGMDNLGGDGRIGAGFMAIASARRLTTSYFAGK